MVFILLPPHCYFNPRPPRGGRPSPQRPSSPLPVFQSTPSARRATLDGAALAVFKDISIHALREEGDPFGDGLSSGK